MSTRRSLLCLALVGLWAQVAMSQDFPVVVNITSPITLAIQPACGTLDSENFTEINTGINLSATRFVYECIHTLM